MDFMTSSKTQRAFLDKLIAAAEPGLAAALQSQFEGVLVAAEEHCPECFTLKLANRSVRLPRGGSRPLSFGVTEDSEARTAVDVLLWQEGGCVESVVISWVGDAHPKLENIDLESR